MPALGSILIGLDRKPYPAYRDLRGRDFAIGSFRLCLEHVQGDPFASPSRLRVDVESALAQLPDFAVADRDARRATADYLQRRLRAATAKARRGSGSGKSGQVEVAALGQEVLERTAVQLDAGGRVEIRLTVGLPAAGRRILGRAAADLLCAAIPQLVNEIFEQLDRDALQRHVQVVADQVQLRSLLAERGLVAFVADGALLPRASGADDRPLAGAVPFAAPESLRIEVDLGNAGTVRGLGIRRGVTLIVGGGYHGKSTLLQVLARGVYDHIPGDGRELCATVADAVSVRAEDGRSVCGVDLRGFISNLPLGRSTAAFDSDDASGSTSQAAAIVEALETGASALLIDEDTAATNFMIRDARMRALIPSDREPITPLVDRARQLAERGVSTVLVVGGAGDYLDVADTVIQMDAYRPLDVSQRALQVAREMPRELPSPEQLPAWPAPAPRIADPASLDPSRGRRAERVRAVRTRSIEFGSEEIDVALLAQLVDAGQCRMIGDVLLRLSRSVCDGERDIGAMLDVIEREIAEGGLSAVTAPSFGDRAMARRHEIAAALNRLRSLRLLRKI